jgi:hypothetical protein
MNQQLMASELVPLEFKVETVEAMRMKSSPRSGIEALLPHAPAC